MSGVKGMSKHHDRYDEVAVERLITGHRVGANGADYAEAIIRLARRGYSDGQIAYAVQRSREAVARLRRRRGCPPAIPPIGNQDLRVDAPTRPKSMK